MKARGFTLIELLIVVAITGLLASIALPSYQTYTMRAQIAESLVIVGELQGTAAEYYKHTGRFPANNAAAGMPAPQFLLGNYVKRIEIVNGAFNVTFGNKANAMLTDKVLTIRPIVVKGSPTSPFSWLCGNGSVPDGMEAIGRNETSLESAMMPSTCRI
ncbi:MAG TPA: pilin [Pseudomonadales bacterium]|nr:pilin [Pseudomonadales bacterium]